MLALPQRTTSVPGAITIGHSKRHTTRETMGCRNDRSTTPRDTAVQKNALKLTELSSAADAYRYFSHDKLWQLFDGDRAALNIAHE